MRIPVLMFRLFAASARQSTPPPAASHRSLGTCFARICSIKPSAPRQDAHLTSGTKVPKLSLSNRQITHLFEAVKNNDCKRLIKLFNNINISCDLNKVMRSGLNLLHLATKKDDPEMVKLLVDRFNMDPNVLDDTRHSNSALFYAAQNGCYQAAKILCETKTHAPLLLLALREANQNGHAKIEDLLHKQLSSPDLNLEVNTGTPPSLLLLALVEAKKNGYAKIEEALSQKLLSPEFDISMDASLQDAVKTIENYPGMNRFLDKFWERTVLHSNTAGSP